MSPTPSQQLLIRSRQPHTLALAGPGSGKTASIIERVIFLLGCAGIHLLAVVTFTRAAATELVHRLAARGVSKERVVVGTFHSFCIRQVLEFDPSVSKNFLKGEPQRKFYEVAAQQSGWPGTRTEAAEFLNQWGASLNAEMNLDEQALVTTYLDLLASTNRTDFSVMVKACLDGMSKQQIPGLAVQHLLVDEAQDIDAPQLEWILTHARAGVETTLVADDDQSIYRFRFAMGHSGLLKYKSDLRIARPVPLSDNFRSGREIVRVSQNLIQKNSARFPKKVTPFCHHTGSVEVKAFSFVYDQLSALTNAVRSSPRDWAVIARTNRPLHEVELALLHRNIPYWIKPTESIWESQPGQAFISLLKSFCSVHPAQNLYDCLATVAFPSLPKISNCHLQGPEGLEIFFTTLEEKTSEADLSPTDKHAYQTFRRHWRTCNSFSSNIDELLASIPRHLNLIIRPEDPALLSLMTKCIRQRKGSLAQRIEFSKLSDTVPTDVVHLTTMHSSKGLEFTNVWLYELDSRHFPANAEEIEEERRITYVGFTRAKERLLISYQEHHGPSPFISEAGLYLPAKAKKKRARRKHYI